MMCPWASRIRARRSLRPVSGALMDPLRPPERIHRLSRAAPTMVAALSQPRGERLRSEGTNNALRRTGRALRSLLGVVCVVLNVIEAPVHPRFTVPRRGALQPRQASTAPSEIFGNVVFGCRGEAKSGKEARLCVKALERMSTGTIDYM